MTLPFNPKTEIFRWGPIPGRFFYSSVFTEVNYKYFCQRYLKQNWSRTLFLFRDGRMLWLNEHPALRRAGLKVFMKYMMPGAAREKIYRSWKKIVEKMLVWHEKIDRLDLSEISDGELARLWKNYHKDYIQFWVPSTVPELGNYGADKYLEKRLSKFVVDKDLTRVMEILTAPIKPSFYQEEEMALAATENLAGHRQKYFWIKNSYAGTQVLPVDFFAKRKKEIDPRIGVKTRNRIAEIKREKNKIVKEFNISKSVADIAEAVSEGIAWQDERKKYIFIVLHYQDILLQEVGKRFGYEMDDLHNAWYYEIFEIISGKDLRGILSDRRRGFGVDFHKSCRMLNNQETDKYWKIYTEEKVEEGREIRGVVVSRGKNNITRGRVRILLYPHSVSSFKQGEILVAPMTSPEYIFVMKKAAVIITDTGGLTSHAAIVSRELSIPCIVGAKIATKVLKDGDIVEVDAEKGIISIV